MRAHGAAVRATTSRRTAGWLAAAWCGLFALLHVFWAAGGSTGLASASGRELASRRPATFVLFGLWGVAVLLVTGAGLAVVATLRAVPAAWLRGFQILAWIAAAVLVLRALFVELALATDLGHVRESVGSLETRWSLILWNPWCAIGGICFFALALDIRRRRKPLTGATMAQRERWRAHEP